MDNIIKVDAATGLRRIFYLVTPNETAVERVDDVKDYIDEANAYFAMTVVIEELYLRFVEGDKTDRFAAGITSITAGMFMILTSLLTKTLEYGWYEWVYQNYCLVDLPWDSPWTWIICMIGVDFGYYWFHRMAHEVNIMWAAHQVHHSSEEYNLTTALRQSILQRYTSWFFYLPLALVAPTSLFLVHLQFNLLYQFWIHTEVIRSLGPFEYIFNTPSHHRVHHGRNRYCIDKNYAGTLIIWDRMFGTFVPESDPVAYGLVHPLQTWNPITVQFCHLQWIWSLFWKTPHFWDKMSVIFKGPGWEPGKPRAGLIEDIPDIMAPQPKYHTDIPRWLKFYILFQALVNFFVYMAYIDSYQGFSQLRATLGMVYIIYTFTTIGALCDVSPWSPLMEMFRCTIAFAALTLNNEINLNAYVLLAAQVTFALSTLFWLLRLGNNGKKKVE